MQASVSPYLHRRDIPLVVFNQTEQKKKRHNSALQRAALHTYTLAVTGPDTKHPPDSGARSTSPSGAFSILCGAQIRPLLSPRLWRHRNAELRSDELALRIPPRRQKWSRSGDLRRRGSRSVVPSDVLILATWKFQNKKRKKIRALAFFSQRPNSRLPNFRGLSEPM